MADSNCPNCGNVLTGDRPSFCDQCGCDLSNAKLQQDSPAEMQRSGDPSMSEEKHFHSSDN